MNKFAILAVAAGFALATPAIAQEVSASPGQPGDQPSGGAADQTVSAATGAVQGSTTGEGNMNGPNRNGQPDSAYPTTKQMANMRGQPENSDPNAPAPSYYGQAAGQ